MIAALIVAAGKGVRMGAGMRKQYLPLSGLPVLAHTLKAFDECPQIDQMVLVVPFDEIAYCRREIIEQLCLRTSVELVAGGARRQDSVCNGLDLLDDRGIVLIHDGVRPLVSRRLIEACIEGVRQWEACIPVVAITDTLKKTDSKDTIELTVPRDGLGMAQTPQGFRVSLIKRAHDLASRNGWEATDDASLVERMGAKVHTIAGSSVNIKITRPGDLRWAEALLNLRIDPESSE
jgi:2-C-methyl-D-erythritol 4-phosphate cytidylyltransferase